MNYQNQALILLNYRGRVILPKSVAFKGDFGVAEGVNQSPILFE